MRGKTIQKELERLHQESTIKVKIHQDIGQGGYLVSWDGGIDVHIKTSKETLAFIKGIRVGVPLSPFKRIEVPSSDHLKEGKF